MGVFSYSEKFVVEFDDRTLAHLQVVIGAKLRRAESFYFSWPADPVTGRSRATIWLNSTQCLMFTYETDQMPDISRAWVDALSASANSGAGLQLLLEPAPGKKLTETKTRATR